jgi:hypothetical protein
MDCHRFESLEVIVDNEQGLIVERTIALRPYPALMLFRDAHVCIAPPCMHRSRISFRPMFGTTQRHSVTTKRRFRSTRLRNPLGPVNRPALMFPTRPSVR